MSKQLGSKRSPKSAKTAGSARRPASREVAGSEVRGGARVQMSRLKNGMRVLIAERHLDPVVAVMVFYRVGARNETEREAGVSHFLEHMMFKGTRRLAKGEVDRLTTELGGQNNAFTGNDHTGYWFEFASDRWERALKIEAERMKNLRLDPLEFEAERQVVLEELAMGEDDPWRVLARRVEAIVFQRHPYGRPIIGFADTVRGVSLEQMRSHYRRFYHPGNATLVIAGDVVPAKALAAARRAFGPLAAGPAYAEVDPPRAPIEEPAGEMRLEVRWPDQGRRLCVAWPTVAVGTRDDYALDLVATILTSGRNSRLQRRLVLDGALAVHVSASNDTRVEGGAFWLFAECSQGTAPEALESAVDDELARIAREPVSTQELERALALIRSGEAHDAETVTDLAEELGGFAVDIDWRLAFDGAREHAKLTPADLSETVARLLARGRRVVGWCLPRPGSEAVAEDDDGDEGFDTEPDGEPETAASPAGAFARAAESNSDVSAHSTAPTGGMR